MTTRQSTGSADTDDGAANGEGSGLSEGAAVSTSSASSPASWIRELAAGAPEADAQALLAALGGKGLNLARMTGRGFPVPPGFVITTAAYRRVAAGA
ncbi:MAG: hypothetical protein KC486_34170, partial [Myxococcales bacterium]|nr:hypothetical protein [Myxococcales bacterium]